MKFNNREEEPFKSLVRTQALTTHLLANSLNRNQPHSPYTFTVDFVYGSGLSPGAQNIMQNY